MATRTNVKGAAESGTRTAAQSRQTAGRAQRRNSRSGQSARGQPQVKISLTKSGENTSEKSRARAEPEPGRKSGRHAASSPKGGSHTETASETGNSLRTVSAAICIFLTLFCVIGYFQVDAVFITVFRNFLKSMFGYGYYLAAPALAVTAWLLLRYREEPCALRVTCALAMPAVFGALVHVLFSKELIDTGSVRLLAGQLYESGGLLRSGGLISGGLGLSLKTLFSVFGATPLLLFLFFAAFFVCFGLSPVGCLEWLRQSVLTPFGDQEESDSNPDSVDYGSWDADADKGHGFLSRRKKVFGNSGQSLESPEDDTMEEETEGFDGGSVKTAGRRARRNNTPVSVDVSDEDWDFGDALEESLSNGADSFSEKKQGTAQASPETGTAGASGAGKAASNIPVEKTAAEPLEIHSEDAPVDDVGRDFAEVLDSQVSTGKKGLDRETLREETFAVQRSVVASEKNLSTIASDYQYPPVSLLHRGNGGQLDGRAEMGVNKERLQMTLDSFNVSGTVTDATRGPTVTRYDIKLDTGVKLAKLTNLDKEIALSLGVAHVRIAPIPDKIATVGVEVPNKTINTVYLRDIIDSEPFQAASSRLTFALGEDIGGNCVCGNIAKLPHLLIAGTTGSGKSVCMNSLILSLLFKASPEELRLIMIDPKMVELGIYNGIPHLYIPVVTDPKKAAGALQWAVVEMLKRYKQFSEMGVRELASYNQLRRKAGEDTKPQVVVVIDELADLMMIASKEVEESICRVAQMGRAAGIHLVIATQRPSADVITGLMKANIPSRIAFAVSSAIDSRIILDTQGAEKLIGNGDMLYAPIGIGKPLRLQGAFVTDEEREQVVSFIKANSEARYSDEIMRAVDEHALQDKGEKISAKAESSRSREEPPEEKYDTMLPQAAEVIFETKQASVSMMQRRLKLGYSRAARIMDQLEAIGVVGPFEGSKPRQIKMTLDDWNRVKQRYGAPAAEPDNSTNSALSSEILPDILSDTVVRDDFSASAPEV